jgi:hypothetical protein
METLSGLETHFVLGNTQRSQWQPNPTGCLLHGNVAVSNFVVLAGASKGQVLGQEDLPEIASMTIAARALMVWAGEGEEK